MCDVVEPQSALIVCVSHLVGFFIILLYVFIKRRTVGAYIMDMKVVAFEGVFWVKAFSLRYSALIVLCTLFCVKDAAFFYGIKQGSLSGASLFDSYVEFYFMRKAFILIYLLMLVDEGTFLAFRRSLRGFFSNTALQ